MDFQVKKQAKIHDFCFSIRIFFHTSYYQNRWNKIEFWSSMQKYTDRTNCRQAICNCRQICRQHICRQICIYADSLSVCRQICRQVICRQICMQIGYLHMTDTSADRLSADRSAYRQSICTCRSICRQTICRQICVQMGYLHLQIFLQIGYLQIYLSCADRLSACRFICR